MKTILPTLLILISCCTVASTKTTQQPVNGLLMIDAGALKKVCLYADKQYSRGALIELFGYIYQCAPQNQYETNGELAWIALDKAGQLVYPKKQATIRVN